MIFLFCSSCQQQGSAIEFHNMEIPTFRSQNKGIIFLYSFCYLYYNSALIYEWDECYFHALDDIMTCMCMDNPYSLQSVWECMHCPSCQSIAHSAVLSSSHLSRLIDPVAVFSMQSDQCKMAFAYGWPWLPFYFLPMGTEQISHHEELVLALT